MKIGERDLDALRGHALFGRLPEEELRVFTQSPSAPVRLYGKGQVMHLQHEPCDALELILRGHASVERIDAAGSVLRIAAFAGGDIMGANLLFASRNLYPYTVIAQQETRVLRLSRELVLALSQRNLPFLSALMTVISDRTQLMTEKIDAITHKTIRQRITDVLLFEQGAQGANPIVLPSTKKDLAERLGMQRTSLSREMNRMRREGLIAFEGRQVHLTGLLEVHPAHQAMSRK